MDLQNYNYNIENWFLKREQKDFPDQTDYVGNYKAIVTKLEPVHSQVNAGADFTDKTTLTRHDKSHISKVIHQISKLVSYESANLSAYETFHLLIAVQIHDIKNIEGREDHENSSIEIFSDLGIEGLIDFRMLKYIGAIASCHAGSFLREGRKEKDKIGFQLPLFMYKDNFQVRPRFLAALLRLADEFSDDVSRAMTYLLKIKKVTDSSIIHQKHAEALQYVSIKQNAGIVELDYYIKMMDAVTEFPKYDKDSNQFENKFLLDEIFSRTVKSHYETIYCMRFLRPYISINKIKVSIEVEASSNTHMPLFINYEMIESGYPNDVFNIIDLCGESIKKDGTHWNGLILQKYLQEN